MRPSADPRPVPTGTETMSPALRHARNYYAWIAEQFLPILGTRVLDIGGGLGTHLDHVVKPGRFVMSIDLSADGVAAMRKHFAAQDFDAWVGDICEPSLVARLAPHEFDTVLCVNVLEHIRDDRKALNSMAALVRPRGGRLFLFVPAHPLLFGSPDVLAGHFRRYTRRGLVETVEGAGFVVRRVAYFNGLGAIPYFLNSRVLRPRSLGGHVNTQIVLFDRFAVPLLRRIERILPMPFGQSLVLSAEAR